MDQDPISNLLQQVAQLSRTKSDLTVKLQGVLYENEKLVSSKKEIEEKIEKNRLNLVDLKAKRIRKTEAVSLLKTTLQDHQQSKNTLSMTINSMEQKVQCLTKELDETAEKFSKLSRQTKESFGKNSNYLESVGANDIS